MSDSVFVEVNEATWTDISVAGQSGIMTNNGPQIIFVLEAASDPTPMINNGHRLTTENFFTFSLTTGQKIFVRSINGPGLVVVTPD